MNTPINYSTAKLLKEKGFNLKTNNQYSIEYDWNQNKLIGKPKLQLKDLANYNSKSYIKGCSYSAPTIAEAVMWLYEKHKVWMWVEKYSTLFRPYAEEIGDERFGKWEGHKYNSPTEAYEAAIKYVLTKLI